VGQATGGFKAGESAFPAGSYIIKRDQPYGRLAKNLLEKQVYPDSRLTTYDDSGWTMGLLMLVDVKEISDPSIQFHDPGDGGATGEGLGQVRWTRRPIQSNNMIAPTS
jgi:hypothetical protein